MSATTQLILVIAISILLTTMVMARTTGLAVRRVLALTAGPTIAALVGMRFLFVVLHPELGTGPRDWFNIFAGNHAPGGVFGVGLYFLFCGSSIRRIADRVAVSIALAMTIVRLGCAFNGCCRPIAIPYVGLGLGMLAFAIRRYPDRQYDGQVLLEVMVLYFGASAFLEGYRYMPSYWGSVPELQLVNTLFATTALGCILWHSVSSAKGRDGEAIAG